MLLPTLSIATLHELTDLKPSKLELGIRRLCIVGSIHKFFAEKREFSFSDWQTEYLHSKESCRYQKTAKQLLSEIYERDEDRLTEDIKNFDYNSFITSEALGKALDRKVFDTTEKTLKEDFKCIASDKKVRIRGILSKDPKNNNSEQWIFSRVDEAQGQNHESFGFESLEEQQALIAILLATENHHPKVASILERIYQYSVITLPQRWLFHIDNIISEAKSDDIADMLNEFVEPWDKPIFFKYSSSSQDKIVDCNVYPVCMLFYKRVQYLYGWGLNPKGKEHWYAYRLDRIDSQSKKVLGWSSVEVNSQLHQRFLANSLPTPQDVQKELELAWGIDIDQDIKTLILRFDQKYYRKYIENTNRGPSANPCTGEEAIELLELQVKQADNDSIHRQLAQSIARIKGHPEDAYYEVKFREDDNYTIMQLRSWGAKVEVLAPFDLREKMIEDAHQAVNNYG
jgi:CRISPR-associated protein (TIGR03985 family)